VSTDRCARSRRATPEVDRPFRVLADPEHPYWVRCAPLRRSSTLRPLVRSEAQRELNLDSRGLYLLLSDSPGNRARSRGRAFLPSGPLRRDDHGGPMSGEVPRLRRIRSQVFSTSQRPWPIRGFAVLSHTAYAHGIPRSLKFLPLEDPCPSRGRDVPAVPPGSTAAPAHRSSSLASFEKDRADTRALPPEHRPGTSVPDPS